MHLYTYHSKRTCNHITPLAPVALLFLWYASMHTCQVWASCSQQLHSCHNLRVLCNSKIGLNSLAFDPLHVRQSAMRLLIHFTYGNEAFDTFHVRQWGFWYIPRSATRSECAWHFAGCCCGAGHLFCFLGTRGRCLCADEKRNVSLVALL